jgi:hypothetical protein
MRLLSCLTAVGLAASAAIAAEIPRINIEATCKVAKEVDGTTRYQACVRDEEAARRDLERQWASFSPSQRTLCVDETKIGETASYVEVLTCLQIGKGNLSPTGVMPPAISRP